MLYWEKIAIGSKWFSRLIFLGQDFQNLRKAQKLMRNQYKVGQKVFISQNNINLNVEQALYESLEQKLGWQFTARSFDV